MVFLTASFMKIISVIGTAILLLITAAHGESVIGLVYGGEVRGDVIKEQPDRVIVDLGFTILDIPREAIARIDVLEEKVLEEEFGEDLYRVNGASGVASVKELVDMNAEAVVLVRTPTGLGSGFVIHPDGYVVTNDHVIAGEHQLSVTVFDEQENEMVKVQFDNVRIVAASPEMDLALLKIEDAQGREFKTVPIGQSDNLRSGQTVFAIGSPLGLERTVSQGIVSIRNRLVGGRIFIQTTAQINPGNSGGPLFNTQGEVVGVNNMKVAAVGAEGLGFAIPSSFLKTFLRNRDAFAFDPRNPNSGYRYNSPPRELSSAP